MKKMKFIVCILCCAILSTTTIAGRAEDLEATRLGQEIKTKGAELVVARLTSDYKMTEFEKITKKIETGSEEWLEVARLLMPGCDGAAALGLEYAVARALPKAPRRVLELLSDSKDDQSGTFAVDLICLSPYIEPGPGVAEKHLRETERVLKSTNTNDSARLTRLRSRCLKSIQEEIKYLRAHQMLDTK